MEGGPRAGIAEEIRRAFAASWSTSRRRFTAALTPWQTIQVSRHKNRPLLLDYVDLIFDDLVELHGDRAIGDDRAIRCGFARLGEFRVMLIGHQKGRTLKEKQECFYGCVLTRRAGRSGAEEHASGGEEFRLPSGLSNRHAGKRHFQALLRRSAARASSIAVSLLEMSRLETPVVCVVIGEGGRAAALRHRHR